MINYLIIIYKILRKFYINTDSVFYCIINTYTSQLYIMIGLKSNINSVLHN